MHITRLLGSRLARQNSDQRWLTIHKLLQSRLHVVERFKAIHSISAAAKLAGRLRPSQQKNADNSRFPPIEIEDFLQPVLVFRNAAISPARGTSHALFLQGTQGLPYRILVERHHRLAIIL